MEQVEHYITKNLQKTIRTPFDKGQGIVQLPKPFSSPAIEAKFADFYYWDTYFINLGLLADGLMEQAKNNLENIAFFIRNMGYMPNASHLHYTSQVPLFTRAVFDYFTYTHNENVIKEFFDAILIEYDFFMKDRMTEIGLNQYGCVNFIKSQLDRHYDYFSQRVGVKKETDTEKIHFVRNMFAVCESGWDCSPRCDAADERFAMDRFVQIDLNALLYDVENKISTFYEMLGDLVNAEKFAGYAKERASLINQYMKDKDSGFYLDYNFANKELSKVKSTASFYPYVVGISNDKEKIKELLALLELEFGVSTCEYQEKKRIFAMGLPDYVGAANVFCVRSLVQEWLTSGCGESCE